LSVIQSVPCPLCDATALFAFNAGDSFYGVTEYRADLYRCRSCRSLFQHPVPDRATIASFYPSGYWQETAKPSRLARLQQIYINFMLERDLMGWVRAMKLASGSRFLDVGCSRGDWLALIGAAGYQVEGIEADPRAAAYARTKHSLTVHELDGDSWEPEQDSYAGISFFHLLEHLRDPRAFLGKVFHGLQPGGKLLLRIPHVNSLQASVLGANWKGLEIPRHIMLFSRKALVDLLTAQGFQVESCSSWALRDGPPCWASSLLPGGEPTWQQIHRRPSALKTLAYLALTWALTPLEVLAAMMGKGSMLTVIARKP